MSLDNKNGIDIFQYPRYLWFLTLSFAMTLAMSNWYDSRIVEVFGISVTPGSLIYSVTFLLSNTITEVYGFKNARRAILTALLFNVIFIVYGWIVMHLPTPTSIPYDKSFDSFLLVNARIILASFVSCFFSEQINSFIVAKIKIKTDGKYIGIRFVASTIISGFVDSVLFVLIAFSFTMQNSELSKLVLHIWLVKSIIELAGLPLSIKVAKKLKNLEQLDIYDNNTNFTMFSLNTDYKKSDNKYEK